MRGKVMKSRSVRKMKVSTFKTHGHNEKGHKKAHRRAFGAKTRG